MVYLPTYIWLIFTCHFSMDPLAFGHVISGGRKKEKHGPNEVIFYLEILTAGRLVETYANQPSLRISRDLKSLVGTGDPKETCEKQSCSPLYIYIRGSQLVLRVVVLEKLTRSFNKWRESPKLFNHDEGYIEDKKMYVTLN